MEYHGIQEQQRVSGDAIFNIANHVHKTTDMATALDNLVLAATADQNIVMDLIATNRKLMESNTTIATEVKALVATNAILAATQALQQRINLTTQPPSANNSLSAPADIVGPMDINYARATKARHVEESYKDIRMKRPAQTRWSEKCGISLTIDSLGR